MPDRFGPGKWAVWGGGRGLNLARRVCFWIRFSGGSARIFSRVRGTGGNEALAAMHSHDIDPRRVREVVAVVLAGGRGARLDPLTRDRAKPAVPFGGTSRIVDFALSN